MNEPTPRPPGRSVLAEPAPLTRDRIAAYLHAEGYLTGTDDEGDIAGVWNGHRFWFIVLGESDEVLQVRGRASTVLPVERRNAALLAVNDWNRDRIWPKAYVREEEDGLALYGEVSVELSSGVTDEQLGRLVDCGLATSIQLFDAMVRAQPPA
ncbi:MAG TPA: YbjN domain-containing protein [Actinotalea sp.]|nr:YbjN domain-containing protein [Actinotalea sp.]